jgi:hypothetical protein
VGKIAIEVNRIRQPLDPLLFDSQFRDFNETDGRDMLNSESLY